MDTEIKGTSAGSDQKVAFSCSRCGHRWSSKNHRKIPKSCPACRSSVWMKNYDRKHCERCDHTWLSGNERPKRCPACATYNWDIPRTVYDCFKCGYSWNPKRDGPPKRCPKCSSSAWTEKSGVKRMPKQTAKRKKGYLHTLDKHELDDIVQRYDNGDSCLEIAIATGFAYNVVFSAILGRYPGERSEIRLS